MEGKLDLKSLSVDDLTKVINLYPWFGGARKELCARMAEVGGSSWGRAQYSDAAMYVASRSLIFDIVRSARRKDYSDKDVNDLIKEYIASSQAPAEPENEAGLPEEALAPKPSAGAAERPERPARIGGDFFSAEQYASVKKEEDNIFSKFRTEKSTETDEKVWEDPELGFCTETLAGIYADQGYFAEAKKIYSRLILRYPEKSAYFASLIENLRQEN